MPQYKYILSIDTASDKPKVSILTSPLHGEAFAKTSLEVPHNRCAELLLPTIHQLITTIELASPWHKIEAVIANIGPGSWTGIRLGLTVAKLLAWTLNIPIIGASNETKALERLANKDYDDAITLVPLYDKEPNITTPRQSNNYGII